MDFAGFMRQQGTQGNRVWSLAPFAPPTEEQRATRAVERQKTRERDRQDLVYAKRRDVINKDFFPAKVAPSPVRPIDKAELRRRQLVEWKKQRALKKTIANTKKKPPFKVGTVKHEIAAYCPPPGPPTQSAPPRRNTRANKKLILAEEASRALRIPVSIEPVSFAPTDAKFRPPNVRKLAKTPKKLTKTKLSIFSTTIFDVQPSESTIDYHPITNKTPNAKECSTESLPVEEKESRKSVPNTPSPASSGKKSIPASMSPFVTSVRGKNRETSTPGYTEPSPEKSAQYFRLQLDGEISRLQDICEDWQLYKKKNTLIEDHSDLIDVAIGQTQLLINKKFQQFRGLIDRCENQEKIEGGGTVNVHDLQGFWEMIYMQVENLDYRFKNLNELKERNWKEEDIPQPTKGKTIVKKSKPAVKKTKGSNGLKAMIQAARSKSKLEPSTHLIDNTSSDTINFNAGFFSIISPAKSKTEIFCSSPATGSMRRSIISSEAKKRSIKTPLNVNAMLTASSVAKNIAKNSILSPSLLENIASIDLNKTPGKSILKTPITFNNKKNIPSSKKKNVKILFTTEEYAIESNKIVDQCDIMTRLSPDEQNKNKNENLIDDELALSQNASDSDHCKKKNLRKKIIRQSHIDENISPIIENMDIDESIKKSRLNRSHSLTPTQESKILSPLKSDTKSESSTKKRKSRDPAPVLDDSFLEIFGMAYKSKRKSQSKRFSTNPKTKNDRLSHNLIKFNSPTKTYVTRSVLKNFCANSQAKQE